MTISTALSTEASSSGCTETKHFSPLEPNGEEDDTFSIDLNKENLTSSPDADHESQKQISKSIESWVATSPNEAFENSICSVCQNRRPKIGWTRDFTCAELQAATDGFSATKYLSEGGFGSVFKGEINGLMVAVKQHKDASSQGDKEFKSEVQVLSKARHENVVMLLGSCSDRNKRLLVYEYVCNGSLDQHLSSKHTQISLISKFIIASFASSSRLTEKEMIDTEHARTLLSWEKRMKIAMGAAKGLQYLHENNIIHRDMRPNNILVTHDFESMVIITLHTGSYLPAWFLYYGVVTFGQVKVRICECDIICVSAWRLWPRENSARRFGLLYRDRSCGNSGIFSSRIC